MAGSQSTAQLVRTLIDVSRFDKYNCLFAIFPGVWSICLAAVARHADGDPVPLNWVFGRAALAFMYTYMLSGAGMVWNDWIDRDIDAQVARTKNRPLASGRLSTRTALIWMMVQYGASVWLMDRMLSGQNLWTFMLPLTTGILLYPFGKRPTSRKLGIYPQYILGASSALTILPAWASVYEDSISLQELGMSCLPLCVFLFLWTIYFNTAYSYQDIKDDCKLNVNSSYVLAGSRVRGMLLLQALAVVLVIPWILHTSGSAWLWFSWLGVWTASLGEQLYLFDVKDPSSGGKVHRRNFALGIWNVLACSVELLLVSGFP
ncbi:uncharacterized protein N7500_010486 [Penicillium coprophilum]|uniref:uncharacterized protein n=1 Tax=Penicillium coprophilum TaxID=36646 RepID=UPI00239E7601|nr:uncharacterized protein N7500_010486 [Penicillium coprophilum]KAJ5155047.1 hypothetical protein N7500_010486 [Penicillium coprophilum]